MKIEVDNYILCSDKLGNFHIKEKRLNEETHKLSEVRVSGYHKYASAAVSDMIKRKICSSDVTNIVDLTVEVDNLINTTTDLINSLSRKLDKED